jgi:hypothetical protein
MAPLSVSTERGIPGVVVEEVVDLHAGAVGELPVGGVGLPAFVGQVGAEPGAGALGPFAGLRGDEPATGQHPPDRRDSRQGFHAGCGQVGADRLGAGVQALLRQVLAQPDDLVLEVQADRARVGVGSLGPRSERGLAFGFVAVEELLDPVAGDLVVAGDLTLGASLEGDRDDDEGVSDLLCK